MSNKVANWEARGRRPLTIEEVQDTMAKLPLLPKPKELIFLDGVIQLEPSKVGVGATPTFEPTMILTPLSDENTVTHEMIHLAGVGEFGARALTPVFDARRKFNMGLMKRPIKYSSAGSVSEGDLQRRFRLVSPEIYYEMEMCCQIPQYNRIPSGIKTYKLVEL